jgi:beta-lactamase class D
LITVATQHTIVMLSPEFRRLLRTMKPIFVATALLLASIAAAEAQSSSCTLIADVATGAVLVEQGGICNEPMPPASTFKFPLALMGFDAGVLVDAEIPAWPYKSEYQASRDEWKVTTTPESWLRNSVLWYSRVLVAQLGRERFEGYVAALDYGNADVSGTPGADDGMTHSWLNSSLKISPTQQVAFLRRVLLGEVQVSSAAIESTAAVMPRFVAGDWEVRGKTGTAYERKADGSYDYDLQMGWFIGWARRGDATVVFARLLRDGERVAGPAGPRVRDSLLQDLPQLLVQ